MKIRHLGSLGLLFAMSAFSMEEQKTQGEGQQGQEMSTEQEFGLLDQCSRRGEALLNTLEATTDNFTKSMEPKAEALTKSIERLVHAAVGGPSVGLDLLKVEVNKLVADMRGARNTAALNFSERYKSLSKIVEQNWQVLEKNVREDWQWLKSISLNAETEASSESTEQEENQTSDQGNTASDGNGESEGQ